MWKLRCPAKAKLLTWSNFENKTPTRDVLQHRNHHGPGWCSVCKDDIESIPHLFIHCRFVKEVWNVLSEVYGKQFGWVGETMDLAWGSWLVDRSMKSFSSLPVVVSWGIWIYRNRNIFEDKVVTPQLVAANSVAIANHFLLAPSPSCVRQSL